MFESSSCVDKEVVFGSVVVEMKFVSFPVGMEKVLKNLHLHTVTLLLHILSQKSIHFKI